ncbi:Cell division cycle-associated 7-like protein [Drosera capensis]
MEFAFILNELMGGSNCSEQAKHQGGSLQLLNRRRRRSHKKTNLIGENGGRAERGRAFMFVGNPWVYAPIWGEESDGSRHAQRIPLLLSPLRFTGLQNVTPVSYSEVQLTKNGSTAFVDDVDDLLLEKGAKPEFYTEEHEKLLGDTQRSWTLFVDGYSSDGRRIYDPVRGKTCHQCRQKTLGLRTHCSQCQMVQGQFCGDCLYMSRLVEWSSNPLTGLRANISEYMDDIIFLCPALFTNELSDTSTSSADMLKQMRTRSGFALLVEEFVIAACAGKQKDGHPLILKLGFKSVAHYLIQNNRAPSDSATMNDDTPLSAKRSLAFTDLIDEEGSTKEDSTKPVSSELRAAHEDNKKEENENASAMSKLNGESIPAVLTDERKPEGVAGRARKRSNSEILKRIEALKKEETATKDIIASTSSSSGQDSIARRLRPRSCSRMDDQLSTIT